MAMPACHPRAFSPYTRFSDARPGPIIGWAAANDDAAIGFAEPEEMGEGPETLVLPDEGHAITIAPTGSGKGTSCIIPALLTYDGPMIVIDPKGENAAITAERRREMGQTVHVIDPFHVSGLEPSRFNPLDIIDPHYADCVDDAAMIAAMITPTHESDPFWSNRAIQLITGLITHAMHDLPRSERNLITVRRGLHAAASGDSSMMSALASSSHEEARIAHAGLSGPGERTRQSIVAVASDALDLFRGDCMASSLYASSFEMDAVTDGKPMTIYLVLPPHKLASHGAVLRLWTGALFSLLSRRARRPAQSTLIVIDEAAQLGTFDPLRAAITLLRGYGVRTWSFWQDSAQLRRLYADWQTLIGNCQTLQVFGKLGPQAAESTAELLGLPTGDMLRNLGDDDMVVSLRGKDAQPAKRVHYFTDETLAELAAPNPFLSDDGAAPQRPRAFLRGQDTVEDTAQRSLFPPHQIPLQRPPRRRRA